MSRVQSTVDQLFRTRGRQMVAYLARVLGAERLDLAEEAVQEALLAALRRWPHTGVPADPAAWVFRTARHRAVDALRRAATAEQHAAALAAALERATVEPGDPGFDEAVRDGELALLFLCCHPALSPPAQVALGLKLACGLSVAEIARAFLVDEAVVAQRIVRAKRRLRALGVPLALPGPAELARRREAVLAALYLLFNEGYKAHAGPSLVRVDLCAEALRLARLVAASPAGAPRVDALVALMAFHAARLPARLDEAGELVLLEAQDRSRWDRELLALGFHHFELSARSQEISTYHLQAAIAAVHARAEYGAATDWRRILALYDALAALDPSPVVALNRAVALARVDGPRAGLAALDRLAAAPPLREYHLLPATRARLLEEAGDYQAAAAAYREALAYPATEPERRFLRRRLAACEAGVA